MARTLAVGQMSQRDTARGRAAHKSPGATLRRQNFSTALRLFPFENSHRLAFGVPATFPRA